LHKKLVDKNGKTDGICAYYLYGRLKIRNNCKELQISLAKTGKIKKTAITFCAVVAVLFLIGLIWSKYIWFDKKYDADISNYGSRYGVSQDLIYSVIKAESNFDEDAASDRGAVGLMQIMPSTAAFVAQSLDEDSFDLKDPKQNMRYGIFYLSYLATKFDDETEVLAAYNAGEGTVKKWLTEQNGSLKQIPYGETKRYIQKIEFYKKVYNALYK
jgi:soluble lytic murein transglycosylase